MKEIVMMLELSAENDWIDAFYLPFELNPGFKEPRFLVVARFLSVLGIWLHEQNSK